MFVRIVIYFLIGFVSSLSYAQTVSQPLSEVRFQLQQRFAASVEAQSTTQVTNRLSARLQALAVRPGQLVEKGALLARVSCADTEDQLALVVAKNRELQANLKLAQTQLKRVEDLRARDLAALSQKDELKAQVQSLQASIEANRIEQRMQKRQLSYCELTAPFQGVVTQIQVGEGQWLNPGQVVLTLTQRSQAEIRVQLPLSWFEKIQSTEVVWQAAPNAPVSFPLQWLRTSQQLSASQAMLEIWFAAPETLLLGQLGQVVVKTDAWYLPANVMVKRQGTLGVFIRNDQQQAEFYPLPDAQVGRPAPIPPTWSADLDIITLGQQMLQAGQRLNN